MILDSTLSSEPLRTLCSFIPTPTDVPAMRRQIDDVTRFSSSSSSSNDSKSNGENNLNLPRPLPVAAATSTKLVIARVVRIFGGVIIGAAAEEISRSFGHSDESDGDADSDDREPIAEFFSDDPSPSSSVQRAGEASSKGIPTRDTIAGPSRGRHENGSGSFKHPGGGTKRKLNCVETSTESRLETVITGDATPRAPGGRAAVQAKAEGQGCTSFVSECKLPTERGQFRLRAYRYSGKDKSHEPVVMVTGDLTGRERVPVRVHDQCQTSEVS